MCILQYVNLAKDTGTNPRPALSRVYRDTDCLVATNGHRLHWAKQPAIESPHYLTAGNTTDKFPDWRQVIPREQHLFETILSVQDTMILKANIKGTISFLKACGLRNSFPCTLSLYSNGLKLLADTNDGSAEFGIGIINTPVFKDSITLELKYLYDALVSNSVNKLFYYGPNMPLKIETTIHDVTDTEGMAIIMPHRTN